MIRQLENPLRENLIVVNVAINPDLRALILGTEHAEVLHNDLF